MCQDRVWFVRIPIFNVKIYVPFRNKMGASCKFFKALKSGTSLALSHMNLLLNYCKKEISKCQRTEA